MGIIVDTFYAVGAHIPQAKEKEFHGRLEKLFQAGGMMEINRVSMFGIETATLQKVRMREDGMDFYYNYFEDDFWEPAGFDLKENCVWSNDIGWRQFNSVMIAAYVLENLYSDGVGAVFVSGEMMCEELVNEEFYIGWMNALFHEDFQVKNRNPWKLFEAISRETKPEDCMRNVDWKRFASSGEGMIGYSEIYAVQNGVDELLRWHTDLLDDSGVLLEDDDGSVSFFDIVKLIVAAVRSFRTNSDLSVCEQPCVLCNHLRSFYQEWALDSFEFEKKYGLSQEERLIFLGLSLIDLSVIVIKAISETYDKDFWKLWEEVRDVVYESRRVFLRQPEDSLVRPFPTVKFLKQCSDDMIYYWRRNGNIHFSDELKEWLLTLKKRFDEIRSENILVDSPVKWILGLMNFAQEKYGVFAFTDFFEESITHLSERGYFALWKLYEEMMNVRDRTEEDKQENSARAILRRYMALVANADLRKIVFGF